MTRNWTGTKDSLLQVFTPDSLRKISPRGCAVKSVPKLCAICHQPIKLEVDRYKDGNPVHQACFLHEITPDPDRIARPYGESKFDCFA
jgi:hypothetical protein